MIDNKFNSASLLLSSSISVHSLHVHSCMLYKEGDVRMHCRGTEKVIGYLLTCYGADYVCLTPDQNRFTISEVAVDWH